MTDQDTRTAMAEAFAMKAVKPYPEPKTKREHYEQMERLVAERVHAQNCFLAGMNAEAERVKPLIEALEMGAFHHGSCDSNRYADGTTKPDWNGFGDGRLPKPCTCARKLIDEALEAERLKTDKYLAARNMEQLELKLAYVRTRMESVKERIVRELTEKDIAK